MADLAICRRCKKRSLEHDPMRREWRCLWRDCDYVESEPAHAAAIKYEAIEALGRAIQEAYLIRGAGLSYHHIAAQTFLRFLGCVNEKGEVMALERGAVGKALGALARECEFCHEMHSWHKIGGQETAGRCGPGVCGVWDAKAALRGEGGET